MRSEERSEDEGEDVNMIEDTSLLYEKSTLRSLSSTPSTVAGYQWNFPRPLHSISSPAWNGHALNTRVSPSTRLARSWASCLCFRRSAFFRAAPDCLVRAGFREDIAKVGQRRSRLPVLSYVGWSRVDLVQRD